MDLETFASNLERQRRRFVSSRLREVSSFCSEEQIKENLDSLNNEFDWMVSRFFAA